MSNLDRHQPEALMAGVALAMLYLAAAIWWSHSGMDLCTMSEPLALKMSVVLTFIPYLAAIALLARVRMGPVAVLCGLPAVVILLMQAVWAVQLFVVTNVNGMTSCYMIDTGYYGLARGGWLEQVVGPYFAITSVISIVLIAASHLRYRASGQRRVAAEVFD